MAEFLLRVGSSRWLLCKLFQAQGVSWVSSEDQGRHRGCLFLTLDHTLMRKVVGNFITTSFLNQEDEQITWSLICGMMVGTTERCPPPCPYYLSQARELTLPLTSCSTKESRPCTLSGQHSRVAPVDKGTGEPTP